MKNTSFNSILVGALVALSGASLANPASAQMAGFDFLTVKSTAQGNVDMNDLAT